MPKSVLEAIKLGVWNFEPQEAADDQFDAADAMPGTKEKIRILTERLQRGLPLWHDGDRDDVDAPAPLEKPFPHYSPK